MLPSAELTDARTQAEAALDQSCTIQTYTETNTKGSVSKSWANTYTAVSCRLAALRQQREFIRSSGVVAVAHYVLTVAHGQAIGPEDRVVIDSSTYEVVGVEINQSYRTARRAYLALVS